MAMPLGASFAPTFENARQQRPQGGGSPSSQALQVLSYNLTPRVAGAPGVSPLQGQRRSGSSVGQAVLESVLRTVLGPEGASEALGADRGGPPGGYGRDPGIDTSMTGAAPNPTIHVGDETRAPLVGSQTGADEFSQHAGYQEWMQRAGALNRNGGAYPSAPSFGGDTSRFTYGY